MRRITVTILFLALFSTGTICRTHLCRTNVLYAKSITPVHAAEVPAMHACSMPAADNIPARQLNADTGAAPVRQLNADAGAAPVRQLNADADAAPVRLLNTSSESTLDAETGDSTDSDAEGRTDADAEGRTDSAKESNAEGAMPSLNVSSPSVLLMEAETGTILYQKNEHDARPPASVTKIMTLNLIFDAIDKKQIALTDEVTVSETAAGMGGSQVYLEAGEIQTVETLIKCISIASANDACVAYMNSRHYLLYGF